MTRVIPLLALNQHFKLEVERLSRHRVILDGEYTVAEHRFFLQTGRTVADAVFAGVAGSAGLEESQQLCLFGLANIGRWSSRAAAPLTARSCAASGLGACGPCAPTRALGRIVAGVAGCQQTDCHGQERGSPKCSTKSAGY